MLTKKFIGFFSLLPWSFLVYSEYLKRFSALVFLSLFLSSFHVAVSTICLPECWLEQCLSLISQWILKYFCFCCEWSKICNARRRQKQQRIIHSKQNKREKCKSLATKWGFFSHSIKPLFLSRISFLFSRWQQSGSRHWRCEWTWLIWMLIINLFIPLLLNR